MSIRRWLLISGILGAAAVAVTIWMRADFLPAAKARIEAARDRQAKAQIALRSAAKRLHVAEDSRTQFTSFAREAKRRRAAESRSPSRDWAAEAKRMEDQRADPKIQLQKMAAVKSRLRDKFNPLYRKLSLGAGQISAFEDAEAAWEETNQDIYWAAMSQHIDNDDPAVKALYGQAARERNAAEKSILGRDGSAQLRAYRQTLPIREFVSGFDGVATVGGVPLSDAQKEPLVQAIAETIPGYASGKVAAMSDVDWARVDVVAATVLSPDQLELLKTQDAPTHSGGGGGRFWLALNNALQSAKRADAGFGATGSPTGP